MKNIRKIIFKIIALLVLTIWIVGISVNIWQKTKVSEGINSLKNKDYIVAEQLFRKSQINNLEAKYSYYGNIGLAILAIRSNDNRSFDKYSKKIQDNEKANGDYILRILKKYKEKENIKNNENILDSLEKEILSTLIEK